MKARRTACALLLVCLVIPASAPARTESLAAPTDATHVSEPCEWQPPGEGDLYFGISGDVETELSRGFRSVGEETLWIFDADFEDLLGDNAGWTSLDMSGTPGYVNYWHKDTIHINGFDWLGDTTWWCGTYNNCWRQPRGYGNNWICMLERVFPEVAANTSPGDEVVFKWDQRYALELDYDYGYIDVSGDGGETWTTIETWTNYGFAGTPGRSIDWDTSCYCHQPHRSHDLSEYAGQEVTLRFRCETDVAYSSQDQYNNPPLNSCLDGAWQLDNFEWTVNGETFWYDDCESPGDNGWMHDNIPASGQAGVTFERVFEPDITNEPFTCFWCPEGWWMVAVDPESGMMVDDQNSWLLSPPIDISGAESLVAKWDCWFDCPRESNDLLQLWLVVGDSPECVYDSPQFTYATPARYGGPWVLRETDDWDNWAWGDWLGINWRLWNDEPPEPGGVHKKGFMLDRQRVGVAVGGPPTVWEYWIWERFHDTFDVDEVLSDPVPARIRISDGDGILSAFLVVSSDGGASWESLPLTDESPVDDWWLAPVPVAHIAPATEIRYYFEATDGAGNVRTHPRTAPDSYYEFSILPIHGSVSEPAILLVDKHGRVIRNEDGEFRQTSEQYFREVLDILGFEYDVYDVEVPSGSTSQSNGPDSAGYKYYDTQIWFTDSFNAYTIKQFDQANLISWLSQSQEGKERNLLLTGNDIGQELVDFGKDTLDFYSEWLASEYIGNDAAGMFDTLLVLRDAGGGFMTHDDGQCVLRLLEWDYG